MSYGADIAVVKVAGMPVAVEDVRMLPVTLTSHSPTGTYTGSVDLATGTAEPVDGQAQRRRHRRAAVDARRDGLGFLAGLGYTLWTGGGCRAACSSSARANSAGAYAEAKTRFDADAKDMVFRRLYARRRTRSRRTGRPRDRDQSWARHTIVVDHDAAEYQAIIRLLQTAEDDATLFGDKLAASLKGSPPRRRSFRPDRRAAGTAQADGRTARRASRCQVGGATRWPREADAYAAFAPQWLEHATEVKRLALWSELIRRPNPAGPTLKAVNGADADVAWARQRLLEAENAADLTAAGFDAARAQGLRPAHGSSASRPARRGPPRTRSAARLARSRQRHLRPDSRASTRAVSGAAAVVERAGLVASQALIPLVGAIVAIVIGLPTIFSDDTFGSWQDYLAAITLGVAAAVGAKGVLAVAQGLVRRETLS